jgi:hypothetical protein
MKTQDAVIILTILIGGPIVLGVTFYFIDELFKAGQKYMNKITVQCLKRRKNENDRTR